MQIRICLITLLAVFGLASASITGAQTPPPRLFFTDLDSGPNSGGESVGGFAGAYVTIYGNFLGVGQGTSGVTWNGLNCLRVVGPTGAYNGWGSPHFWYQKLVVQIGSSCVPGAGNFVITTANGTSNGVPFTVRPIGSNHIYFVSATGNDGNAGTAGSPLLTIAACKNKIAGGDICYIEGGVVQSAADGGFGAALDIETSGSAGFPMAIGAYPGATPQPQVGGGNTQYVIRVPNIGISPSYWTFFGLYTHQTGSDRAVNTTGGNPSNWRFIANKTDCLQGTGQIGCIEWDSLSYLYAYGNEVTNAGAPPYTQKQYHAFYVGTDTNHVWVAWNHIHDNPSCRAIQTHSSPIGPGTGNNLYDLHIHDNIIHGDTCEGINFATINPSEGVVEAYNNVIYHVGLHLTSDGAGDFSCIVNPALNNSGVPVTPLNPPLLMYNNTCYDIASVGSADTLEVHGALGSLTPPNMTVTNNLIVLLPGEQYLQQARQVGFSGANNDWFGAGAAPTQFTNNLNLDPLFVSPGTTSAADFHLQSSSPMIGAGTNTVFSTTDIDGKLRPNPPSIGAYEFGAGSGSSQTPNPPTNLTVVVQ
jgi:hypothetical protein